VRRLSLILFVTLVIASCAYIAGTSGQLPPRVAVHFGGAGEVNAAMPRDAYVLFTLALAGLLPSFVVASIAGLPLITQRGVKLPNRAYLLAPPRRQETLIAIGAFGGWLGCLLTLFFAAMHYTILDANTNVPPVLRGQLFYSVLGGFFAAVVSWQALFYSRFRTPH
jgi:hypothetical protein